MYNLNKLSELLWTDQSEFSSTQQHELLASPQRLAHFSRLPAR
jgi:hypothetical protein